MQIYDKKKKKKKRGEIWTLRGNSLLSALLPMRKVRPITPVFSSDESSSVILIQNLELQRGEPEKGIDLQTHSANALFKRTLHRSTNRLYGPRNVVWVTGLIIDSVRFLTDTQAAQLIKPVCMHKHLETTGHVLWFSPLALFYAYS